MVCPICQKQSVVNQEGRLYCTNDKVYLGMAKEDAGGSKAEARIESSNAIESRFSEHAAKLGDEKPIKADSKPLIKNLIYTLFVVVTSGYFFFSYFFYTDFSNGCYIQVYPSVTLEFSNGTIMNSLRTLKKVSMSDYKKVCDHVKVIKTDIACAGFGGGCHYSDERNSIYISSSREDIAAAIAILVHETCHAMQTAENRSLDEDECYRADDRILQQIVVH